MFEYTGKKNNLETTLGFKLQSQYSLLSVEHLACENNQVMQVMDFRKILTWKFASA